MKIQQKHFNIAAVISLVIGVFFVGKMILFNVPADQPVARSGGFATNCYAASGSTWTADDGCTWLVKSGGTFQMDSGSTLSLASNAVSTGDGQYRNITATGTLSVTGASTLVGAVTGKSNATFTGDVQAKNITATGTLSVSGAATMISALNMSNAVINNIGNAGTAFDASGGLTANNGFTGTLHTAAQTTVTALGTLGYLTVTNPISMAGATFTGPIKYGVATNYTSGAAITHGFALTPTVCGMLGSSVLVTATVSIAATTTFSFTTGANGATIYWMCGQ